MPESIIAYVGIGSNVARERSIGLAAELLRERFPGIAFSPVYESEAVGFRGEPFFNLVAGFPTSLSVARVCRELRAIERRCGRTRRCKRFASRTLDLDLLLYGDKTLCKNGIRLPREEITEFAFVLRPLAELAGEVVHPTLGRSFAELWSEFDGSARGLRLAPFQIET